MERLDFLLVLASSFIFFLIIPQSFAIHVTITRKNDVTTIACILDESESKAKELMALSISRQDGTAIAILQPDGSMDYYSGFAPNFKASGYVGIHVKQSYLHLTASSMNRKDSGEYTCQVFFHEENKEMVDHKASAYFNANDYEIAELRQTVNALTVKLGDMQKESAAMRQTMNRAALERKSLEQLMTLVQKSQPISFIATTSNAFLKPRLGYRVIFPSVIQRFGKGYDASTGLYTAPVTGQYAFQLQMKINCNDCYMRTSMLVNNVAVLRFKVVNKADQSSSGSSGTGLHLNAGDRVALKVDQLDGTVQITPSRLAFWSGYLVSRD